MTQTPQSPKPATAKGPNQSSLTIAWQMPDPPVQPRDSFSFSSFSALANSPAAAANSQVAGKKVIGDMALALIRHAFNHNLSRFTAWQPSPDWDAEMVTAFKLAASIYKRGVSYSCPTQPETSTRPLRSGTYKIEMVAEDSLLLLPGPETMVVVDGNVAKHWQLPAFADAVVVDDVSEQNKSLELVEQLLAEHSQRGRAKHWLIFGGGILTDAAAFAADLAGCSFTLVPTTLLAMADACVGGKTGVNFSPYGKNQLGRFAFPAKVVCCPDFLMSLPERELLCGIAECLKHGILSGDTALIDTMMEIAQTGDFGLLRSQLLPVMAVKADVVAADPGEAGLRATLNFGHTLGHAIEALCQDHLRSSQGTNTEKGMDEVIRHGEAVYYGMAFAAILSAQYAGLSPAAKEQILNACTTCLPTMSLTAVQQATGFSQRSTDQLFAALYRKMTADKKNTTSGSTQTASQPPTKWVLLEKLGSCAKCPSGTSYTVSLRHDQVAAVWPMWLAALR